MCHREYKAVSRMHRLFYTYWKTLNNILCQAFGLLQFFVLHLIESSNQLYLQAEIPDIEIMLLLIIAHAIFTTLSTTTWSDYITTWTVQERDWNNSQTETTIATYISWMCPKNIKWLECLQVTDHTSMESSNKQILRSVSPLAEASRLIVFCKATGLNETSVVK